VLLAGLKRHTRDTRRLTREQAVRAQYENAGAVSGYAPWYEGSGPPARFFHSRLHVVEESLRACPGGALLDVGCGPGLLVRHLLDTRSGDFRITACDRSAAMIDAAADRAEGSGDVELTVARIEDMPFPDESFDVAVAMGVLEYANPRHALREMARVVRPGGVGLVSMLNPLSPYRLFEWFVYWPGLRLLGGIEGLLGVPAERRHRANPTGIRAIRLSRLCRMMHDVGLKPEDVVYFDLTPLVPPFDKLVRRWTQRWRSHPERTVSRGARRWMGTAYLVTARRA
jgi:ubiquinone/menaquinone biosynthesis C-methylase UbiE